MVQMGVRIRLLCWLVGLCYKKLRYSVLYGLQWSQWYALINIKTYFSCASILSVQSYAHLLWVICPLICVWVLWSYIRYLSVITVVWTRIPLVLHMVTCMYVCLWFVAWLSVFCRNRYWAAGDFPWLMMFIISVKTYLYMSFKLNFIFRYIS